MTVSPIAIRNVYVMMAYAFRAIRGEGREQITSERFDHLHDLFAEIMARGVGAQVKRGLHRDYLARTEELGTVRGRIDVSRTVGTRSITRGRLVCEFDEYEPDTPHNRVLKSVIVLLLRHGDVDARRKDALRRVLPYLEAVTLVAPGSIRWQDLTYHRANASYRLLLGACELVIKGLLPASGPGKHRLASWISDDAMSALYERFLREYYAFHHPELSPRSASVGWDYDEAGALGTEQLPAMRTDVTMRKGMRTLILDAKYYGNSMQTGAWGKPTVHSAHLYQVLSYVKNADLLRNGSVRGLLLYARTEAREQPNLEVVVQGNRIGARSVDLDRSWDELRAQLEAVVSWLDD